MSDNDMIVCHIHDGSNRQVGKGVGSNVSEAMNESINDAQRFNSSVKTGSFACADSSDKAHKKAGKINSGNVGGLPEMLDSSSSDVV